PIQQALLQRAQHPIYGYTRHPHELRQLLVNWQSQRHGWAIEPDWLVTMPGVVPTLYAAVKALTNEGDAVIVQPPVYTPFFSAVTDNNRRLLLNPLKNNDGHYEMDFEHLEQCAKQGAKLLLLCSPHNPIGRVWTRDELLKLIDISNRYDMTIISDEIHADLVYAPHQHVPLLSLDDLSDKLVTIFAPGKTFNIPGLSIAFMVASDPELRAKLTSEFKRLHIENNNPFTLAAVEAAYAEGVSWVDALLPYLAQSQREVVEFVRNQLPQVRIWPSEGTFLMWLDFRALGLDDKKLQAFLVEQAKVGLSAGISYGQGGEGFMRLNIAAPRAMVLQALDQIKRAVNKLVL
ncbi:MAG: PatB family C-S lyase, partial [Gammaproteobacteria bacterium]|nr:PatB family C-S lyase [Gammaproteobacteria bacterium]